MTMEILLLFFMGFGLGIIGSMSYVAASDWKYKRDIRIAIKRTQQFLDEMKRYRREIWIDPSLFQQDLSKFGSCIMTKPQDGWLRFIEIREK